MSQDFRAAASRQSDHYAAKREWSKKLLLARKSGAPRRALSQLSPNWNVVGVGVSEKVVNNRATGIPAITFLVQKKETETAIGRDLLIPREIAGLPTDVEEVGRIHFMQNGDPGGHSAGVMDPVAPGCSVGFRRPGSRSNAGTLGAFVVNENGQQLLLSNFHVFADLLDSNHSFEITQPGILDDPAARSIGQLERGQRPVVGADNSVDAALARIASNITTSPEVLGVGPIAGKMRGRVDMIVEKFGRSTLLRAGRIVGTLHDIFVEGPGGDILFVDQIAIRGLHGDVFGEDGDSGALVLERSSNKAVGLLFAHGDGLAFANHLSAVLTALKVDLVK